MSDSGRKTTIASILVFVLLAVICAEVFGFINLSSIGTKAGEDVADLTGMVAATRKLSFVCNNQYGGAAIQSATLKVYKGLDVQETLTTDGTTGIVTSGLQYTSGDVLRILLVKGNAKLWYDYTVPKIRKADQDAVANIQVPLQFFDIDTSVTIQLMDGQGNAYSDTNILNFTTLGVNQIVLTVSGYVSADDKSYISSFDPLNNIDWEVVAFGALSGTNYEALAISGWHGSHEKGTTLWGYRTIPDSGVTKNKIGNLYEHDGVFSFSLTLDKGGYSGDAAALVFYLQGYADPAYHRTYGSYGPDTVAMASTFTLNIDT